MHQTFPLAQAGLLPIVVSDRAGVGRTTVYTQSYRRCLFSLLFHLGITLLLSGCLQAQEEPVTAALPLDDNLPITWTPLGDVQAVNIDGDDPTEYLLFFTYDGSSGPVGAVIYNTETDEEITGGENASSRLSTSFIPYSILPSYRPGTGQGFIAEPAQRAALGIYPVTFHSATATNLAEQALLPNDALAILGGNTYLTWVWWQPQQDSYGVTQLYGSGGFEAALFQPFNWDGWRAAPAPIRDIIAAHPLHDRSLLCRRKRYILVAPASDLLAGGAPIDRIEYREIDLGLNFCNGAPAAPFYPEAVVLSYLLSGEQSLWDQQTLGGATLEQFEQLVARGAILRINDLASYKTIPGTSGGSANGNGRSAALARTTVCAEILLPGSYVGPNTPQTTLSDVMPGPNDDRVPAQGADGLTIYSRRWLLFTLRHEPPQRDLGTSDRLYLTNVEVLPVPTTGVAVDCGQRLEG